jgi:release factor glutamine methyltransferase
MQIREALAGAGLDRLEAQTLLGALLDRERAWLIAHDDAPLSEAQAAQFSAWCARRRAGEPIAYLTGFQEFHGLRLQVSPATLVPRPDTETLVDWALALLPPGGRVADLGTGSGAIALAIKAARPDAAVHASDRSPTALTQACANGERLGLQIHWHEGSWFAPLAGQRFDLIVSNPPYIAAADPHLPGLRHEPASALVAGADGLDDLRQLVAGAPGHLQAGGWLLLEHGHDQAGAVAALFAAAEAWRPAEHRQDLAGHRRCTGAQCRV